MSNTDIRIDVRFFGNHKTKKLKKKGGADAVLSLITLWIWAATNKPDGDISDLTAEDIELVSEWPGEDGAFSKMLTDIGWLDQRGDGFVIHDWKENQPWASQAAERGDKARLSRLARANPEIYEELRADGVTGVSRKEYMRYTNVERT